MARFIIRRLLNAHSYFRNTLQKHRGNGGSALARELRGSLCGTRELPVSGDRWLAMCLRTALRTFLFGDNVFRLRPFLTLCHFHRDGLTFLKRFESFHLNRAVMDKNILATLTLNESKSFIVVEPLDSSGNSFA